MSPKRVVPMLLLGACAPSVHVFPLEDASPAPMVASSEARPVRIYLDDAPRCPTAPVASMLRARARALRADAIVGMHAVTREGDEYVLRSGQRERTGDSTSSKSTTDEKTAYVRERESWLEGVAVRFRDATCRE